MILNLFKTLFIFDAKEALDQFLHFGIAFFVVGLLGAWSVCVILPYFLWREYVQHDNTFNFGIGSIRDMVFIVLGALFGVIFL
jgi:hypothetical protein